MIRKYLLICLVGLSLVGSNSYAVFARQTADKDLEKIKADVQKTGTGAKNAKVVVNLKNGIKLKGYLSQILDDSFDITDPKTGQPTTIPYRDVAKVKRQGWSTGAKVALGIGIGAAVVTLAVLGAFKREGLGSFCPLGCSSMLRP